MIDFMRIRFAKRYHLIDHMMRNFDLTISILEYDQRNSEDLQDLDIYWNYKKFFIIDFSIDSIQMNIVKLEFRMIRIRSI